MPTLTVRDINSDDYENLQRIAKSNNRSTSAQVRDMIASLGRNAPSAEQAIAELLEFRRNHSIKPRPGEDAVSIVRSIRGE